MPDAASQVDLATLKGVAFAEPPAERLPSIRAALDAALAELPPDRTVSMVSVFNETGANAVIVGRLEHGWDIYGYIGKEWRGDLRYGGAVRWSR